MYIHVKVKAGVGEESMLPRRPQATGQPSADHFEISVREKAEHNIANKKVLELVARYFKVSPNKVRIVNGHRSPSKLLVVDWVFANLIN